MLKFGDVAVVVRNARAASVWWHEKLGFEVRSSEGHWVTVAPKGADFVIHLCETRPLERGNTGIGFTAKDVMKESKALAAKGVRFTKPARKAPWGTFAKFADPDGNEFWINEE
jgi:catechol 2,3-dioxygenase-like lactoylglutathione lyase family enzyme